MNEYKYIAITSAGKKKKGEVFAENLEDARNHLKDDSYVPLKIVKRNGATKDIQFPGQTLVKNKETVQFLKQLSSVYQTGLPMVTTLNLVRKQTSNRYLSTALYHIIRSIENGTSLSESMRKEEKIFSSFLVEMVYVGEQSGTLAVVLDRLASYYEKVEEIRNSTIRALIYPAIVVVIVLGVLALMVSQVLPKFEEIFASADMALPWMTEVVISGAQFMRANVLWMILMTVVLIISGIVFSTTQKGKYFFGYITRKIPIVKGFVIHRESSMFANTLSILLYAGISMLDGLEITKVSMKNIYFIDATDKMRELIMLGNSFGSSIIGVDVFPETLCQMVAIGESSGQLSEMLDKTAIYYEEQTDIATQRMLAALEPMLMLMLSGAVAFIVFAIVIPMFSMYGAVL